MKNKGEQPDQAAGLNRFDGYYREYYPLVYRFLYRMLTDSEEARDMTQDTFIKLYRCMEKEPPLSEPRAWLLKVAVNTCYSMLRRKETHRKIVDDERTTLHFPHRERAGNGVEEQLVKSEQTQRVRRALSQLSIKDRMILELFQAELPYRDIARIMKVRESTVGKKLYRARTRLTKVLNIDGTVPQPGGAA